MGARLARLARTAQVLVVTHLPQVAAYADRHALVREVQRRFGHQRRGSPPRGTLSNASASFSRSSSGVEESDSGPRPRPRAARGRHAQDADLGSLRPRPAGTPPGRVLPRRAAGRLEDRAGHEVRDPHPPSPRHRPARAHRSGARRPSHQRPDPAAAARRCRRPRPPGPRRSAAPRHQLVDAGGRGAVVNAQPMIRVATPTSAGRSWPRPARRPSTGRRGRRAAIPHNQPADHDGVVYADAPVAARPGLDLATTPMPRWSVARVRAGGAARHPHPQRQRVPATEQDLLLDGRGLPDLETRLTGGPPWSSRASTTPSSWACAATSASRTPAILAVGPAADDLLEFGWVADVVVVSVPDRIGCPRPMPSGRPRRRPGRSHGAGASRSRR